MRVSVLVFPGSNCDHDALHAYGSVIKAQTTEVWHTETDLKNPDLVVIPGGFTFGDYLRTGAMAKVSPITQELVKYANKGGKILGICNGFQILCELGLLPGALLQNVEMKFISKFLPIRVETTNTFVTKKVKTGEIITCPIAHNEGNFYIDNDGLKSLQDNDQIVFRYCAPDGSVDANSRVSNPNGSMDSIAGVCNKARNIVGLMPHPERAIENIVSAPTGRVAKGIAVMPSW